MKPEFVLTAEFAGESIDEAPIRLADSDETTPIHQQAQNAEFDIVQAASEESFPASDPPARTCGREC